MAKIEIRRKRTKTGEEEDKTRTRAQQQVIRKQPNSNREDVEENKKGWDTDEKVKRETRATRKQSKHKREAAASITGGVKAQRTCCTSSFRRWGG